MAITFKVDDVVPAVDKLVTKPLSESMPAGAVCLGREPSLPVVTMHRSLHPLLYAIHLAFSEHRPLRLTPDAVWLTIAHGFAQHVRLNAERLRHRFVSHQGRQTIEIDVPSLPEATDAAGWSELTRLFRSGIADRMGQGIARLLTCDFSTTTEADRVASEIILMDAVSPYFDFSIAIACGIPEIVLEGTSHDWKTIRQRIDVIGEFDLGWWANSLTIIADEFVATAEGRVNSAFWQDIYKPQRAYGAEQITGWAARLFPYLTLEGSTGDRNPIFELPFGESKVDVGPRLDQVSGALSEVLVRTHRKVSNQTLGELAFVGGLVAVHQDDAGVLSAISGFMVKQHERGMLEVIEQILRDHTTTPDDNKDLMGSAEQNALKDRVGTAQLKFGSGTWELLGWRKRDFVNYGSERNREQVQRWFNLPGDRFIGCLYGQTYVLASSTHVLPPPPPPPEGSIDDVTGLLVTTPHEVFLYPGHRESTQPFEELESLGDSLAAILAYALEHDGAILPREKRVHFER